MIARLARVADLGAVLGPLALLRASADPAGRIVLVCTLDDSRAAALGTTAPGNAWAEAPYPLTVLVETASSWQRINLEGEFARPHAQPFATASCSWRARTAHVTATAMRS